MTRAQRITEHTTARVPRAHLTQARLRPHTRLTKTGQTPRVPLHPGAHPATPPTGTQLARPRSRGSRERPRSPRHRLTRWAMRRCSGPRRCQEQSNPWWSWSWWWSSSRWSSWSSWAWAGDPVSGAGGRGRCGVVTRCGGLGQACRASWVVGTGQKDGMRWRSSQDEHAVMREAGPAGPARRACSPSARCGGSC